ncbi:MAG: hypothetical protein EOO54_22970 [Haliea sp.]|nr:MAG: hypothetical protein EOO54_22970 [Haliea sp.]
MTAAGSPVEANSACPRCGAAFRCGMTGGDSACWCVTLPHLLPVPSGPAMANDAAAASCFCPACLQQITDERQQRNQPAAASH